MTIGAVVALTGIVLGQMWQHRLYPWLATRPHILTGLASFFEGISALIPGINWKIQPDKFVFNGQWINFFAMASALGSYVVVSLIEGWVTKAGPFNLERMLHRGEYAVKDDHVGDVVKPVSGWRSILPTAEFTRGDKVIWWAKMAYTLLFIAIFLIGTGWAIYHHNRYGTWFSDEAWARYWWIYTVFSFVLAAGTTVWFLVGGLFDLRALFRRLSVLKRNPLDMGMVLDHRDLADQPTARPDKQVAGNAGDRETTNPEPR